MNHEQSKQLLAELHELNKTLKASRKRPVENVLTKNFYVQGASNDATDASELKEVIDEADHVDEEQTDVDLAIAEMLEVIAKHHLTLDEYRCVKEQLDRAISYRTIGIKKA